MYTTYCYTLGTLRQTLGTEGRYLCGGVSVNITAIGFSLTLAVILQDYNQLSPVSSHLCIYESLLHLLRSELLLLLNKRWCTRNCHGLRKCDQCYKKSYCFCSLAFPSILFFRWVKLVLIFFANYVCTPHHDAFPQNSNYLKVPVLLN